MQELWQKHRLKIGWTLMVLSIVPWGVAGVVPFTSLPLATGAAVVTGSLILAEVIFVVAVLVLGKPAWEKFKERFRTAPKEGQASDQKTAP